MRNVLSGASNMNDRPRVQTVHSRSKPSKDRVMPKRFKVSFPRAGKAVVGVFLIVLSLVLLFGYFFAFLPASNAYAQAKVVRAELAVLSQLAKDQNLPGVRDQVQKLKVSTQELEDRAAGLAWTKVVPFVGSYYGDFEHGMKAVGAGLNAAERIVNVVMPYAELIGLTAETASGSTLDRIAKLVDTMDKIVPELDSIEPDLAIVRSEINKIDPGRYAFNKDLQSSLELGIVYVNDIESVITDARPFLEALPQFLGRDKPAKYMVIFLNDKELRNGGGFLSAYARLVLDKGRVISSESADIYKIDEKLPVRIQPPEQIIRYLPEPNGKVKTHWQTRDSNVHPDFKANAELFEYMYQYVAEPDWDGIIAVDTHVVEGIVRVLGSVELGGVSYTAEQDPRCACPQVIYALESTARGGVGGNAERKALIGDLMQVLLVSAFKDEKKLPLLAAEGFRLMNEKHVQLYMHDEKLQAAAEHMDWAGRIAGEDNPMRFGYVEGKWDYFLWSEANYAAQKANLYVQPRHEHDFSVAGDGSITKTVKMTNVNPRSRNDFLNARYRAYFRAYVPPGSELIRSSGSKDPVRVGEEFGKTYFEGFYELAPGGQAQTIELVYTLPFKYDRENGLDVLYQKQAGVPGFPYELRGSFGNQNIALERDLRMNLKQ